ncbi:MAG: hypothetical protein LBI05_06670 [Planctomycetaceae bacterium]|jgi:hypothetical protein|nr:hypothetical protein [Planctomycetaceae bacterium]
MRCSIFTVVLISALAVGCQGPQGGFYQSPYRANGVDGPGPGVIPNQYQPVSLTSQDMMAPPPVQMRMPPPPVPTSQVNFLGVESLIIKYDARVPYAFDSAPLICPATHDFGQGAIYRLKLSNIPGHPGKELFPTLEIAPTAARTQAFLAHSSVPVEFTDNDFDQAFTGNFVTKVVYLPNPEFQGIAMSAVGTLVNTSLQPGVDPIVEASKRGSILAVIRMGNKDLANRSGGQQPSFAGGPGQVPMMGGGMMYPTNGTGSIPQNVIAGVNAPHYGVPMTKTTTGVPGPPQLPQDMHYAPNRSPVLRTEPMPAPPSPRTFALPGQSIPNPYVPPAAGQPG